MPWIRLPQIRRSLCIYDQAKNKIVAFYEGEIDRKALSRALVQYVPNFMVPNVFVQVETMPLTKNGKIDRKAVDGQISGGKIDGEIRFSGKHLKGNRIQHLPMFLIWIAF